MGIQIGSKIKAVVAMENDLRDEGMGIMHCASIGDTLTVHALPREGVLTVSRENSTYQFNCSLAEISEL